MTSKKSILGVGSIALDSLETINGSRTEILGGSSTYFALAANLFSPVSLVGVVGDDFPQEAWDLFSSNKIDTHNVQVKSGKTFRWGGRYSNDYSTRETLFTELGVFEQFQPTISEEYKKIDYLFLGNIQPDLQLNVATQMDQAKTIVCDTMNLWIDLCPQRLWDVIKSVDIFMLNDEEAIQLTNKTDIYDAANQLLENGPTVVIIKQGGKGALLAYDDVRIQIPVFPIDKLIDPTGAGDSFAGGFIGHLVNHGKNDLIEAVISGAAVASFTVSGFGVDSLLEANIDTIDARKNIIRASMKNLKTI
ncbi:MAG: sugar kinase [Candidatus Marinimicrobia bacterium]|nr:sugar kinase [Candidatus Neomarinimicrobiota bacterium]